MIGRVPDRLKARLRGPFARLLEFLTRWSGGRVGLALVYHRLGEVAEDTGRHLVPAFDSELFERQLLYLQARYRIVPGSELMAAVRGRRRGEPIPVAVTFDDDLPAHLQVAAPIMRRVHAPATFFLTGAHLHGAHVFWWESLQLAFDRGLVDSGALDRIWPETVPAPAGGRIHDVALAIQKMPRDEREAVNLRLLELIGSGPPNSGMGPDDVRSLAANGLEIGFHTRRHDQLVGLSDEELAGALQEGRAELEELAGGKLETIAYPHGVADARVAEAARAAGFRWGFTVRSEPIREHGDPLLMGRLEPSRHSVGHLAFEVARKLRQGPGR
jgi:peptidoglycan/xylan/chitin deacetylase (PgdA/CDA1 family)